MEEESKKFSKSLLKLTLCPPGLLSCQLTLLADKCLKLQRKGMVIRKANEKLQRKRAVLSVSMQVFPTRNDRRSFTPHLGSEGSESYLTSLKGHISHRWTDTKAQNTDGQNLRVRL